MHFEKMKSAAIADLFPFHDQVHTIIPLVCTLIFRLIVKLLKKREDTRDLMLLMSHFPYFTYLWFSV